MGLLGDIYSAIDTKKRQVKGLLDDFGGTVDMGVRRFREDQQSLQNLFANAYPMAGDRTVLNSPQQIAQFQREAADKAGDITLAGMFVGKGSKTWDAVQASRAMELEKAGVDARKIWSETGTWKGPEGAWRQEIADNAATLKKQSSTITDYMNDTGPSNYPSSLNALMDHGHLQSAYPEIANMPLVMKTGRGSSFEVDPFGQRITVGASHKGPDFINPEQTKSSAIHEIQHAIQSSEGFAKGGAPYEKSLEGVSGVKFDAKKGQFVGGSNAAMDQKMFEAYQRLAGEAEARATQARIPLDAAQRRALFPADSYDVPMDQLIIRGLLK